MNRLLENIIRDRFKVSTLKMEHLRSSASYERALDLAFRQQYDALEDLLVKIQIIKTAGNRRANDRRPE
jgi:hypothetical protein